MAAEADKEAYIEGLFSSIAPRYDLMNTVISLARHSAWRRFAATVAGIAPGGRALDVCCGTGEMALELAGRAGRDGLVVGADFSLPMIEIARRKAARAGAAGVGFVAANACRLPFADGVFDCVTVGFGLRNVADLSRALSEMSRVAKPGGRVMSLEIVEPKSRVARAAWKLMLGGLAPGIARLVGTSSAAYRYLPRSVGEFVSREGLADEFVRSGLRDVSFRDLSFGAVTVHVGTKPEHSAE